MKNPYVVLLRGLNVGGHNKISMADLKDVFSKLGFATAKTIGATGVIFIDVPENSNRQELEQKIGQAILETVELVLVPYSALVSASAVLPVDWNQDKNLRHNVLFMLDNLTTDEFIATLHEVDPAVEKVFASNNIVFWTSPFTDRKLYNTSKYAKLAKNPFYKKITIRNGNTFAKILAVGAELLK